MEKVCEESSGREATSGRESALLLDCEEEMKFFEELQFAPTKLRRASELVLILGTHVSFSLAPFLRLTNEIAARVLADDQDA